jgi:hypothetical protein
MGCAHVSKLIDELHGNTCCERIKAAKKLGSRLHADFCANPEVLAALINALQCDPCWEVRRAAAWSILMQNARTDQAVLALFIASKTDHHCLVRDGAAEALDILTLGHQECFRDLLKKGAALVIELKKAGYRPGTEGCQILFESCAPDTVVPTKPVPEKLPAKPAGAETLLTPAPLIMTSNNH